MDWIRSTLWLGLTCADDAVPASPIRTAKAMCRVMTESPPCIRHRPIHPERKIQCRAESDCWIRSLNVANYRLKQCATVQVPGDLASPGGGTILGQSQSVSALESRNLVFLLPEVGIEPTLPEANRFLSPDSSADSLQKLQIFLTCSHDVSGCLAGRHRWRRAVRFIGSAFKLRQCRLDPQLAIWRGRCYSRSAFAASP